MYSKYACVCGVCVLVYPVPAPRIRHREISRGDSAYSYETTVRYGVYRERAWSEDWGQHFFKTSNLSLVQANLLATLNCLSIKSLKLCACYC